MFSFIQEKFLLSRGALNVALHDVCMSALFILCDVMYGAFMSLCLRWHSVCGCMNTFVIATTGKALDLLKQTFVECSVLRFSCEFAQENTLPFLDVKVTLNRDQFMTSV